MLPTPVGAPGEMPAHRLAASTRSHAAAARAAGDVLVVATAWAVATPAVPATARASAASIAV